MVEVLTRVNGGDLAMIFVFAILGLCAGVFGLLGAIVACVRRYRERQQAASIILDMLDRGVTPDEIARVLAAAGWGQPRTRIAGLREKIQTAMQGSK